MVCLGHESRLSAAVRFLGHQDDQKQAITMYILFGALRPTFKLEADKNFDRHEPLEWLGMEGSDPEASGCERAQESKVRLDSLSAQLYGRRHTDDDSVLRSLDSTRNELKLRNSLSSLRK